MTPVEQKTKALDERAAIKEPLCDRTADVRVNALERPIWAFPQVRVDSPLKADVRAEGLEGQKMTHSGHGRRGQVRGVVGRLCDSIVASQPVTTRRMGDSTMRATGGCLCGAVRFEVTETPYQADYCYCRMCQRSSGSVLTSWADFKALEFRCTRGEIKFYRSSKYAERGFCVACGSTLIQRALEGDWVAVATGSLDDPNDFPPDHVHCGAENRPPWLKIDDDLPHKTTKEAMGYEVEI